MEHIGRHFERDEKKSEDEAVDEGLKQWAISEGVIQEGKRKGEYWLAGFEPAGSNRGIRGQRRSQRLVKEEDEQDEEEPSGHDNDVDEDDKDAESEEDTIEVDGPDVPMKAEDASDDEAENSDADAEAEDD